MKCWYKVVVWWTRDENNISLNEIYDLFVNLILLKNVLVVSKSVTIKIYNGFQDQFIIGQYFPLFGV